MRHEKQFTTLILIALFSSGLLAAGSGGSLVIIGGALQPDNADVYNAFILLGGGKGKIRIAIIPAASSGPVKSGNGYKEDFIRYGVAGERIKVFPLAIKDDASTKAVDESKWSGNGNNKDLAREMLDYTAVFFVGGNQERYFHTLKTPEGKDTLLLTSIRKVFERGGVLGGSSAGAAIMSDPMICGGDPLNALLNGAVFGENACPEIKDKKKAGVRLMPGLGFFPHGLVGQHFIKRGRVGRLIAALLERDGNSECNSKSLTGYTMGFGVDEDTAMVYRRKEESLEVVGRSGILIVDTSSVTENKADLVLHYLEAGDNYSFKTRKFSINPKRKPIEKGKEYYKTSPLRTDIFGKDTVKENITGGLADNRSDRAEGMAFRLDKTGKGNGVHLVFKKSKDSRGFWGKINGKETYSVLHVLLDIVQVEIQVKPKVYQE